MAISIVGIGFTLALHWLYIGFTLALLIVDGRNELN